MGLQRGRETQLFDRMCVLYHIEDRVSELVTILKLQGDLEINSEDVSGRGEALIELWGIFEEDKESCYICEKKQPTHRLCSCYSDVRVSVLNIEEIIETYSDDQIVATYLCMHCRKISNVQAYVVKKAHSLSRTFRMPNSCMECFHANRPPGFKPRAAQSRLGDNLTPQTKEEIQRAVANTQPDSTS